MDNLEYSNDALEVKHQFYNKDFIVYVEGDDDILFWESIFNKFDKKVQIEDVGGIEEIKKLIKKIVEENLEICVAVDNDYNDFLENTPKYTEEHLNVIRTYGHSIENTLYNLKTINKIIRGLSKSRKNVVKEIEEYISSFEIKLEELLILEIANEKYEKGLSVLGTNTCKFLKHNSSIELCETKIKKFIDDNRNKFSEDELIDIRKRLEKCGKSLWSLFRGHFLTNYVINLIKFFVKKISDSSVVLPITSLYALVIDPNNIYQAEEIDLLENKINQIKFI